MTAFTVLQAGKLLKPQTLNENGKPVDLFVIKNQGMPGVTEAMAEKTKPTDYDWPKILVPVRTKDN